MYRINQLVRLLAVVFTISFALSCQQDKGGWFKHSTNKEIDWHDSAYKRYAEVERLFNDDQHDSLMAIAPEVLSFLREHGEWDYYYITWQNRAEDHAWYNEYAEAAREAEAMQKDAVARNDSFGLALSYMTQGIAYLIQDDYVARSASFILVAASSRTSRGSLPAARAAASMLARTAATFSEMLIFP